MKANEAHGRFIRNIAANVRYWLRRTEDLQRRDVSELDADRQNIYRAVQFGLASSQAWPDTAQLILQSWPFVERRGYWRDWIPFLSQAAARCSQAELPLKCRLLNRLGQSQRLDRQWSAAMASHEEAEAIARDLGDEHLTARARYHLCSVYFHKGLYAEATRYGLEALATFRHVAPDSKYVAATLIELGNVARRQGEFALAERRYVAAIDCYRRLDNAGNLATTLLNLAETLQAVGRFEEALAHYQEGIHLLATAGDELKQAWAQTNLGALYYQKGDYAMAEQTFRGIDLGYLRRIGDVFYQAIATNGLGNVLLAQGRPRTAESYLRRSHSLWLQLDDEVNLANTIGTLAEALVAQGNHGEALPLYEEACRLLTGHSNNVWGRNLLEKFTRARQAPIDGPEK